MSNTTKMNTASDMDAGLNGFISKENQKKLDDLAKMFNVELSLLGNLACEALFEIIRDEPALFYERIGLIVTVLFFNIFCWIALIVFMFYIFK